MFLPLLTALALSSGLTLATPLPQAAPCAPIHIMSARGSNQPAGEGPTLTPLASAIAAAYPAGTTTREPIVWPAQLFPYDVNSHNGTLAVAAQLTAYAKRCPTSKIVLLGYSQGAHVIMDSLCGGGGQVGLGSVTRPIDQKIGSHVTAFVGLGDPRHVGDAPYNEGTSVRDGLFPRPPSQSCSFYADRMQSYCDTGDFFCDRGLDMGVHGSYLPKYMDAAVGFVKGKLA